MRVDPFTRSTTQAEIVVAPQQIPNALFVLTLPHSGTILCGLDRGDPGYFPRIDGVKYSIIQCPQ